MLRKIVSFTLATALLAALAVAQEGHPLTGTWHGDWGTSKSDRTPIVFYMKWDKTVIDGVINPGRNSLPITKADLDAEKWMVHFESQTKDGEKIVADGKMGDIGSYNRTITGTWTQGGKKGDFKLVRD
jgi:hypothetical protein